jgi:major membrane immunogen (membrane-anchored lipoprotein)
MKIRHLLLIVIGLFSVNIFADNGHTGSHSRMCVTAYLANPVHVGDITFYYKNKAIGNVSVYGAWLDEVSIDDGGYFTDYEDFEAKKEFLTVENIGSKLTVTRYTYQYC